MTTPATPDEITAQVVRLLNGELYPAHFERWLLEANVLQDALGEAGYARLLTLGFDEQVGEVWQILRTQMGDRFPAAEFEQRARRICEGILDGSIDALVGLRRMRELQPGHPEWIKLDRATASLPSPEHRAFWTPESLAEPLEKLERVRPRILDAARAFIG